MLQLESAARNICSLIEQMRRALDGMTGAVQKLLCAGCALINDA
ncbi:hypothetical protein [Alloyangia pacifica]|nr:hypothetical protein [Alloyangia pacifica]